MAAYDQLLAEGCLLAHQGSGTVVNPTAVSWVGAERRTNGATPVAVDFRPNVPELGEFPRAAWLRATQVAFENLPNGDFGYVDERGLGRLRSEVAEYLGRVRGVVAGSDQVVICNGFGHGLSLLADTLPTRGTTRSPSRIGNDGPAAELRWLGLDHHPVPVDDDGIVVDELRSSNGRIALVTPAHQSPTGAALSRSRRCELTTWARCRDWRPTG